MCVWGSRSRSHNNNLLEISVEDYKIVALVELLELWILVNTILLDHFRWIAWTLSGIRLRLDRSVWNVKNPSWVSMQQSERLAEQSHANSIECDVQLQSFNEPITVEYAKNLRKTLSFRKALGQNKEICLWKILKAFLISNRG